MNPKGLVEMVKRWHKLAVLGTKRVFFSRSAERMVSDKGHFAVYAGDGSRFEVPLHFLQEPIFIELLKMRATEFGFGCNGPIMLPCDGDLVDSVLSHLRYGQKALCCSL
ncbi:hypothetical protein NE237_017628 [Protea cynaroides]|uniref:SAUR family protein n=1 Tax=Protea cynaroides TaxID=273540 RepID=A0A9Q0K8D5_9MAGN|nr:hypothetical protein NE237_017628 [Protea cynaroides]